MTINFTEAIQLQTVRKLKSHSKVGYQDHPNGDKQCSGCSMFVPGMQPSCTHVAPPIAAHGYCDDFEAIDPNARARAMVGKSFAEVMKDGPPDEARDERGRWTGGGSSGAGTPGRLGSSSARYSSPYRTRAMAYTPGDELQRVRDEKQLREAEAKVSDLQRQLADHSQNQSEDLYWGVHRMLQQARDDLINLRSKLGKAFSPDDLLDEMIQVIEDAFNTVSDHLRKYGPSVSDVHPPTALGNDPGKWRPKWKDFLTTIGEIHGAKIVQIETDPAREAAMAGPPPAMDFGKALEMVKAGPEDEPRDEHGRWTSGGTSDEHLSALRNAGTDKTLFDGALNRLASDKTLKNKDLADIVRLYDHGVVLGRTRDDHLKQIRQAFVRQARFDNKIAMDFGKALAKLKEDALSGAAYLLSKRTVPVLFMRHGPTKFNNQTDMSKDRVRSWNNVPLTKEGIEDAQKAGEKLKDEEIGYIVSSDLGRAIQTSKIVGKAVGIKPIHDYGMRPWQLGKFTGMSTDEAHDGILHYVENPDEVVPEGESFNTFKERAVQTMLNHIKKAGRKKMLVVSHHRNERLFASMRPDGTNDPKKFMKTGEDPGDFAEMEFDTDELQNALRRAKEGQGAKEVSKVWSSNADLPDGVRSVLPGEAQTVWRKVANDRIKAGQSEESAIRQAWTAVKNGWSKTEAGKWVRKSWLEPDAVHEFLEAEIAKLGGETSSIAKPTDEINASLQLTPLDDRNARSPFPYDQYFFANLRNDQKERMLAALTDQDSLEERKIALSALSAVQDRVDPEKIQSMLQGAPEKLAVVVRTGPGRYCIVDGHHRMTAALLSGVKTVPVKYLDIEGFDPTVHTDDNPGAKGEPVNKALAMGIDFEVRKTDEDQQLVFGWASIASIGGVDVVDKQDDIIPEDELEKAAYDFALYCRQQGDMHERMGVGRLVESMVFTKQKQDAVGIDLGMVGWWVGFKVDDPGVWKRIKAGDLPEFSIGGKARREVMDFDKALTAARARESMSIAHRA